MSHSYLKISIVTFLDVLITSIFSLDTLCYLLILASNEYIHLFILVYIATNMFYSFIEGYYKILKYLNNVLHICMWQQLLTKSQEQFMGGFGEEREDTKDVIMLSSQKVNE